MRDKLNQQQQSATSKFSLLRLRTPPRLLLTPRAAAKATGFDSSNKDSNLQQTLAFEKFSDSDYFFVLQNQLLPFVDLYERLLRARSCIFNKFAFKHSNFYQQSSVRNTVVDARIQFSSQNSVL